MLDGIMNAAKGSVSIVVMFLVAGLVGSAIYQVVGGEAFDVEGMLRFAVSAAVAGFTTALVFGAAKG
ncbi:MAG: hypothetical protein V3R64_05115 [Sphingomonadales bacterium]